MIKEFIGKEFEEILTILEERNPNVLKIDLINCAKWILVELKRTKIYSDEEVKEFELNYCPKCIQMTNHYKDGSCAKCLTKQGDKK